MPQLTACPSCAEPLEPEDKFCGNCGAAVTAAAAVPPAPAARTGDSGLAPPAHPAAPVPPQPAHPPRPPQTGAAPPPGIADPREEMLVTEPDDEETQDIPETVIAPDGRCVACGDGVVEPDGYCEPVRSRPATRTRPRGAGVAGARRRQRPGAAPPPQRGRLRDRRDRPPRTAPPRWSRWCATGCRRRPARTRRPPRRPSAGGETCWRRCTDGDDPRSRRCTRRC